MRPSLTSRWSDGVVGRLRVFISYSRSDVEFAQKLGASLASSDIDVVIDTESISPGDAWKEWLSSLISTSDTFIFLISPDSARSKVCNWELEEANRIGKKIVPVLWRPVDDKDVPKMLSALNYSSFSDENQFTYDLKKLLAALLIDVDWLREHTRLGLAASRWDHRLHSNSLLLRGRELREAEEWAATPPRDSPFATAVSR